MVFYLKYRPQIISDLDSTNVRDTLKAVLADVKTKKKSLPFHAFLFTGPKGLGKTSTARIVAKFLNCEKRKPGDLEPCNKCYQCTSITAGNNMDVVEIDAASNRGIDEIRELKERINLSTVAASYKVYIIDEVHMLTTEAFNALLKTLEEPPSHVVFVLCTTEPQKVPATIVSRCLHIPFRVATNEELKRSFKRIIKGENLSIEDDALNIIADLSDGSFRDGSKILQELSVKAKGRKIIPVFVQENFKTTSVSGKVSQLIELLEEKDTKKALELVGKVVEEGIDAKYFVEELISSLHLTLLAKITEKDDSKFTLEEVKKLLELLISASSQLKYSVLPQLPLELAIVEFCSVDRGPVQSAVSTPVKQASSASSEASAPSTSPLVAKAARASNSSGDFLNDLILKINLQNRSVAGLLRGVSLKSTNGKKVSIETKFKFHKEKLEERKTKELIEKIASEILKKNVTIDILLN
ncbi:MAG TPA: DNA polymerase III subunit gamma/tau, partial [Patescibacteria group bacterium]|nr:DNA polymerase III subunit gamma/tau [Patescibacteria group bacterium]